MPFAFSKYKANLPCTPNTKTRSLWHLFASETLCVCIRKPIQAQLSASHRRANGIFYIVATAQQMPQANCQSTALACKANNSNPCMPYELSGYKLYNSTGKNGHPYF